MQTWHDRFFESTRGRVMKLLCGASRTVGELAQLLGLTDNAVRAHLASLERDGLVHQSGRRPGTRKPNFSYDLTPEGHRFFPKAHGLVLNRLVDVLVNALTQQVAGDMIRQTGWQLVDEYLPGIKDIEPAQRLQPLLDALTGTGAIAEVEQKEDQIVIHGCSCPLSDVVSSHPELCVLTAGILSDLLGRQVTEHCQRSESPRCCFNVNLITE